MITYNTNEFRSGLKLLIDHIPYSIIDNEFVKPGKGQAFNRVKLRNLITNRVVERTFKSGENISGADVTELEAQYLYKDNEYYYFMQAENFEQYQVELKVLGKAANWLKSQEIYTIIFWDNTPLSISPPNFVQLQIMETDPGIRGDTSGSCNKPAILETGVTVRVPLFIQQGEVIKVDTRSGEYVSRIK